MSLRPFCLFHRPLFPCVLEKSHYFSQPPVQSFFHSLPFLFLSFLILSELHFVIFLVFPCTWCLIPHICLFFTLDYFGGGGVSLFIIVWMYFFQACISDGPWAYINFSSAHFQFLINVLVLSITFQSAPPTDFLNSYWNSGKLVASPKGILMSINTIVTKLP